MSRDLLMVLLLLFVTEMVKRFSYESMILHILFCLSNSTHLKNNSWSFQKKKNYEKKSFFFNCCGFRFGNQTMLKKRDWNQGQNE